MLGGGKGDRGGRDNNTWWSKRGWNRRERARETLDEEEGRVTKWRRVGRSWSVVGRAVRVSKRKNEPLKELFGDRGQEGEVRGEKETYKGRKG